MQSYITWNLYLGPVLLGLGILLQFYFFARPHTSFLWVLLAICMTSIVAYVDSDIVLFVGQMMLLPLLWLQRKKK